MNKASSGDTIYIDNANGQPYEECGNSPNAIQIKKSLSFICPVGVAEIQCRTHTRNHNIFEIPKNLPGKQTISFTSIKFTSAVWAVDNRHDNTRIVIKRCLFENTAGAIWMYNQGKCHLEVDNSLFIDNQNYGIYGQCANVSVRLSSVTFRSSPVRLYNSNGLLFEVFIEGSFFTEIFHVNN